MAEYKVMISAVIEVSDPQELDNLIICKLKENTFGFENVIAKDKDFNVIEYLSELKERV